MFERIYKLSVNFCYKYRYLQWAVKVQKIMINGYVFTYLLNAVTQIEIEENRMACH